MSTTPPPGPENKKTLRSAPIRRNLGESATYGGSGWQQRIFAHTDELHLGFIWRACGTRSEVAPLKEVVLHWPGQELRFSGSPDHYLMLERIDLEHIRDQAVALTEFYRSQKVVVHLYTPSRQPPANMIYMRDSFWMGPEGAVVGRMAAQQRAGEERFVAEFLASLGVPILRTLTGKALLEGADALWMRPDRVLVGVDRRTNAEGMKALADVVAPLGVQVEPVPMPEGVQHLLGFCNFVADDLVVVRSDKIPAPLKQLLQDQGFQLLEMEPSDEITRRMAMNFVTLAPRRIVMPAGSPQARAAYEKAGIQVFEVDVSEYLKGAGGIGCITGILWRG